MLNPLFRRCSGFCLFLSATLAVQAASDYTTPYSFTTLAGLSSIGSDDGPGQVARFFGPAGLSADAGGNLYLADHENNTIRKITPDGTVTTLAGTPGLRGSVDGTGGDALFINPEDTAVDAAGNVYVADKINCVIRKVTPDGLVTTLAGSPGKTGFVDGQGGDARFQIPSGIAIDATGNLFVADQLNNAIRKVTAAGVVTTVTGRANPYSAVNGPVATAGFFYPYRLALDDLGNLYVAEAGNNIVRKISADGMVSTLAGTALAFGSADGQGPAARFRGVSGITTDRAGNVYVADGGNRTIRKITPGGVTTTILGTTGTSGSADGVGTAALFAVPDGLVMDAADNLYVTDRRNNTVRKVSPTLVVTTLAGLPADRSAGTADGTPAAARFSTLASTAVGTDGEVYVADTLNSTVRKISRQGAVTTLAGKAGSRGALDGTGDQALFDSPYGIAVGADGILYVSDAVTNTIRQVTPQGVVTTLAGDPEAEPGSADGTGRAARFNCPGGLAIDRAGNLYVADRDNYLIRKVTAAGEVTSVAGSAGRAGRVDGNGSAAQFEAPEGIAVDALGNIYVANAVRHGSIRKITPAGMVTTLAGGAGGDPDSADGTGTEARFNEPRSLAVDPAGNVYVADGRNHTIRRITPAGVVTTLAGLASAPGNADGTGKKARFLNPPGISVDAQGALLVTSGTTVRKGWLATGPVITVQPQSQTAVSGSNVTFTVTADSNPAPTYQWYSGSTAINGATGSSLSLPGVRASDAGDYTVVVTNALGSVTSSKAALTVTAAPVPPTPATPVPIPTGGGGGGAPSIWFPPALLALRLIRGLVARRR